MQVLNIGGVLFFTSRETLGQKNTFFSKLIEQYPIDSMEPPFVDRDPQHFRYILNWLRGSVILPEDSKVLQELCAEADFYCMADMVREIYRVMPSATTVQQSLQKISVRIPQ
jgi:hypothetical protein